MSFLAGPVGLIASSKSKSNIEATGHSLVQDKYSLVTVPTASQSGSTTFWLL